MGRTFRLVVCAVLACPSVAFAQRFDDIGVRAQGMAGAFVAVADDASATWWNPAGLATGLSVVDLSLGVTEGGGRAVALAFPSLGLSYYRLNISQIQPPASIGSPGSGRQDNGAAGSGLPSGEAGLSQFGATVGQSITQYLVVATTVKIVSAQSDTEADLDVGAMAAFGDVRLGLSVRDLRNPTFGSGTGMFELDRRARAGAAYLAAGFGALDRVVFAVDADLNSARVGGLEEQDVAGGVETWWLGRRLSVRAGGGANTASGGGSFGAFGVSVVPYPRLNIDGALTRGASSTRDRWSLGLRVTF
jgi:hypothetical protein